MRDNTPGPSETSCPVCGRLQSEWRTNNSRGATRDGKTFCCEGCASGGRCTCMLLQTAPIPSEDLVPRTHKPDESR